MPYTLNFTGDFFHIADFIHGPRLARQDDQRGRLRSTAD